MEWVYCWLLYQDDDEVFYAARLFPPSTPAWLHLHVLYGGWVDVHGPPPEKGGTWTGLTDGPPTGPVCSIVYD